MNVSVTNKNKEPYGRKFDGKLYEFPVGEAVVIPVVAAQYLFAYGQTDAERDKILVRNGWQKNGMPGLAEGGPAAAKKRLSNFIFKKAPENAPPEKPAKIVTEGVKQALARKAADKAAEQDPEGDDLPPPELGAQPQRVPGGIAAISPHAKDDGKTILPRASSTLHLPGSRVPLAPPA